MIPRRRRTEKMGVREPDKIRSPAHLKWVRGFDCAVARHGGCGMRPGARSLIEAAHIRWQTDGGSSLKPSDCYVIPLCGLHHLEHDAGQRRFDLKYGIDSHKLAAELWAKSPARRRAEAQRIVLRARR